MATFTLRNVPPDIVAKAIKNINPDVIEVEDLDGNTWNDYEMEYTEHEELRTPYSINSKSGIWYMCWWKW